LPPLGRFLRPFGGKPAELERQIRLSGGGTAANFQYESQFVALFEK